MKFIALTILLASSSSFAFDLCSSQDTGAIFDAVAAGELKELRVTKATKFDALEKQMIFSSLKLQEYLEIQSEKDALEIFEDKWSDGEVAYFQNGTQKISLVHYYPGDNEYGSIFEVKNGTAKMLATIGDGEINCL